MLCSENCTFTGGKTEHKQSCEKEIQMGIQYK